MPEPAAVATDRQRLADDRRYDIPATVIACESSGAQLRAWMTEGLDYVAELARLHEVTIVDLPTGHWPQFTKPAALADAILGVVGHERRR